MKLRNKKTGEIIEKYPYSFVINSGEQIRQYDSLGELYAEWEDYEEDEEPEDTEACKEIGNYFETKEEAEKAVEKLKAWKRLKDKGLTFCAWKITEDGCSVDVETTLDAEVVRAQQKYITDDLNLLFGGEE